MKMNGSKQRLSGRRSRDEEGGKCEQGREVVYREMQYMSQSVRHILQ